MNKINNQLTEKQTDFLKILNGDIDGRRRTIGEVAQMFGMTPQEANKFYKSIQSRHPELVSGSHKRSNP